MTDHAIEHKERETRVSRTMANMKAAKRVEQLAIESDKHAVDWQYLKAERDDLLAALRDILRGLESADNSIWATTARWTKSERDRVMRDIARNAIAKAESHD